MADNTASKTLEDLFVEGVRDIYYAEKKIVKTLPKMAKAANSDDLRAGFEKHLRETEGHVERLEKVFDMLGKVARGKTCPAIDGILEEGAEIMEDYKNSVALDAGLVASAQAVEHYEMTRYGTLIAWANDLGMKDAAALLKATLAEEEATDEALSRLAEADANPRALKQAA